MKRIALIIGLIVLVGGGVGGWYYLWSNPSIDTAREKFGPAYQAKREQFKKLAAQLPAKGSVKGNTAAKGLDPAPAFDLKREVFNTEIVMADQLLNPEVKRFNNEEFDLLLTDGNLLTNMIILGPQDGSKPSGRVDRKQFEQYDAALKLPYLVVVRPVQYFRPRAVGKDLYMPGKVDLEGFLIDLRNDKVLGSFKAQGQTADRTTVMRRGDKELTTVDAAAHSTMWEDARKNVAKALTEITGGTFEFNR